MANESRQTVLLAGAGHLHLRVAAGAAGLVRAGARVVLVDSADFHYSGMAPGVLGGRYTAAESQVDARALIEAGGGEFVRGRILMIDPKARGVHLAGGEVLGYDLLSLNVGSEVDRDGIPGLRDDPSVWTVKPVSALWDLRGHLEERFRSGHRFRVAVVGGGPTGCEVAANLAALAERRGGSLHVVLLSGALRLLPQLPPRAAEAVRRKLEGRGIEVRLGWRVARREGSLVFADGGESLEADEIVLATGLVASRVVYTASLPTHPTDGLRVNARLQSMGDDRVFAGGDCASLEGYDLPRLGVFGVRQAAILEANLRARLENRPGVDYRPQRRWLTILNLGDGTALACRGRAWWLGRAPMKVKDWIDRRFLRRWESIERGTSA